MKIVGLTGGIGSGKSTVAAFFRKLGAATIDTDQVSRDIVAVGSEGLAEILHRFGQDVLQSDGSLDREALRRVVFQDENARLDLEAITHPRIFMVVGQWAQKQIEAGCPLAIIEIPLLFEVPTPFDFDATICVTSTREQQIQRTVDRSAYDKKTLTGILDVQMSTEEKAGRADFTIDNSGSLDDTLRQVKEVFARLTE